MQLDQLVLNAVACSLCIEITLHVTYPNRTSPFLNLPYAINSPAFTVLLIKAIGLRKCTNEKVYYIYH